MDQFHILGNSQSVVLEFRIDAQIGVFRRDDDRINSAVFDKDSPVLPFVRQRNDFHIRMFRDIVEIGFPFPLIFGGGMQLVVDDSSAVSRQQMVRQHGHNLSVIRGNGIDLVQVEPVIVNADERNIVQGGPFLLQLSEIAEGDGSVDQFFIQPAGHVIRNEFVSEPFAIQMFDKFVNQTRIVCADFRTEKGDDNGDHRLFFIHISGISGDLQNPFAGFFRNIARVGQSPSHGAMRVSCHFRNGADCDFFRFFPFGLWSIYFHSGALFVAVLPREDLKPGSRIQMTKTM